MSELRYGIIVFHPTEGFSWSSFGGMPLADATKLFNTWDRKRGDSRVYAIGVTVFSIDGMEKPVEFDNCVLQAFHNTAVDRELMLRQVTEIQKDQSLQLRAARIEAWEMAAQTADSVQAAHPNQEDGALEAAVAIRKMAKHASVGAIPMILHCPECSTPHVDEGEWATRIHRTHQCQYPGCGKEWRPANVPTVGVADLGTPLPEKHPNDDVPGNGSFGQ